MGIKIRLSSLMKERRTNPNDLALKINVSPSTIYSIMQRDSNRIDIDLILKIAHALDVTADELLSDEIKQSEISPSTFELDLIAAYRSADPGTQKNVCKLLDLEQVEKKDVSGSSTDMLA